jgi:hypothetical protein
MMRHIILATILLTGCGGDKGDGVGEYTPADDVPHSDADADADADGGVDDGCTADSQCKAHEICEEPECVPGDRSNGFSEAVDISASSSEADNSVSGHINTAGDKDYWRYVSTGGEFLRAGIDKHEAVPDGAPVPDIFLTLYDPDGEVVTSADNYANGGTVGDADSILYAYLQAAGDYTFVVEDANPLMGGEAWGGEDYTYRLEIFPRTGTKDMESSLEEPLRLDSEGEGTRMTTTSWRSLGVLIDEPGQVDYLAVRFDNEDMNPEVDVDPEGVPYTWDDGIFFVDGVEDLRGSDATPAIQILSPDDLVVSSGIDVGPAGYMKYPALSPGEWIVALSDADGGGGPNHWYFLLLNADHAGDNLPFEEEDNNSDSTANAIDSTDTENGSGNQFSQGSVQGFVDGPGDNDWFTMSAPEDASGTDTEGNPAQWVVVCANSHVWGSSANPSLTIYDASGAVLAEADTSADAAPNATIENIQIQPGEQISIQVNSGSESLGAPDEWYRMKVFIASFEVLSYEEGGYSCP